MRWSEMVLLSTQNRLVFIGHVSWGLSSCNSSDFARQSFPTNTTSLSMSCWNHIPFLFHLTRETEKFSLKNNSWENSLQQPQEFGILVLGPKVLSVSSNDFRISPWLPDYPHWSACSGWASLHCGWPSWQGDGLRAVHKLWSIVWMLEHSQGWLYIKSDHHLALLSSPAGSVSSHILLCRLCSFHHRLLIADVLQAIHFWKYHRLWVLKSWKLLSLWRQHEHITEILPLAQPLGAKLWCGTWSRTYPRRKGWGKVRKGKGKGSRMNTSHKILNMHTCMAGSERLEAFVFACIWNKYDTP